MDLVRRMVADDVEAVDLLDRALTGKHGGDRSKHDNVTVARSNGNAQDAALRRLRKDRPDLHAEVLAGHLSAHAAMVSVGYRKRRVSVHACRRRAW